VSLEGNEAEFMSKAISNPQPTSQTSMNSFIYPRRITLTLNFHLSTSQILLLVNLFLSFVLTNKVVDLLFFFFESSYSSPSSLFSSVLLQRKSQGEMETEENDFLSQTQSFRQYIFVGSLSEYSEERRELQSSTSLSTSGFIVESEQTLCFSNMIS
jgi:hypothetical protein